MAVYRIHVMEISRDGSVPPPQPGVRPAAMPQRGIAAGGPVRQARWRVSAAKGRANGSNKQHHGRVLIAVSHYAATDG